MDLVQQVLDRGVNVTEVFVDTVGDPDRYQQYVRVPGCPFVLLFSFFLCNGLMMVEPT